MKILDAVKNYQCAGCVYGPALTCYDKYVNGVGCGKHAPGTTVAPFPGLVFLGMPKGFNRVGPLQFSSLPDQITAIIIYEKFEDAFDFYSKWNIPVWKHLDKNGNTLVRGMHPRNNMPFIHIYLENVIDKINCFEVSQEMIDFID